MGVLDTEGLRRVWGKIAAALDSLSEKLKNHNHDSRYYTEAEMDSKLNGKAAANHNHDDRYFTETEINNTLKAKPSTGAGSYATLSAFLAYVAGANNGMSYIGKWKDTGGWGPKGSTSWYHGFCVIQNAPGGTNGVDGVILCQAGSADFWIGFVTGISEVSVKWKNFATLVNKTVWSHDASQKLYIAASPETNYRLFLGVSDGAWRLSPAVSGQLQLGGANYKWEQIYSTASTISTSDRTEKHDIDTLDDSVKDFILGLNPVSYKFNDGTSGRTHFGMIAQEVEALMEEQGLSSMDFAGFIKSPKVEIARDAGGTVIGEKTIENEYLYGLRYEEFIAPLIKTVQLQQREIDALAEQIKDRE